MLKSYITALGTAVPSYQISQQESLQFNQQHLPLTLEGKKKLALLYRATSIQNRYTVIPDFKELDAKKFQWFPQSGQVTEFPSVAARMEKYREEALPLSVAAVEDLKEKFGKSLAEVTHVLTVSCTGMYAPGLDIDLIRALKLPYQVQRTAINFMGCYGAFNGLKMADAICQSNEKAKVLVVCTELCTLHYQTGTTEDELLSAALFADGSAAALVESTPNIEGVSLQIEKGYTEIFPDGEHDMTWNIGNHGFEMMLSAYVPKLLHSGIFHFIERLLKETSLTANDIPHWAIHPGGKEILNKIEEALLLPKEKNGVARHVLSQFGNMSSATILFVLSEMVQTFSPKQHGEPLLSLAFGPGLTVESLLYKICYQC